MQALSDLMTYRESGSSERRENLFADYATYTDAEFTRLCEVQRQTMGNRHKYRPAT